MIYECLIRWKNDRTEQEVLISTSPEDYYDDEEIFYYASKSELLENDFVEFEILTINGEQL